VDVAGIGAMSQTVLGRINLEGFVFGQLCRTPMRPADSR
jgi:hypothetical protein